MMRKSPCLTCDDGENAKDSSRCKYCDKRVQYVQSLGDLFSPSAMPILQISSEGLFQMKNETIQVKENLPIVAMFTCRRCGQSNLMSQQSSQKNLCKPCRQEEQRKWRLKKKMQRISESLVPPDADLLMASPVKPDSKKSLNDWHYDLFAGYDGLKDIVLGDAIRQFRDLRMQVLWIIAQHYPNYFNVTSDETQK